VLLVDFGEKLLSALSWKGAKSSGWDILNIKVTTCWNQSVYDASESFDLTGPWGVTAGSSGPTNNSKNSLRESAPTEFRFNKQSK